MPMAWKTTAMAIMVTKLQAPTVASIDPSDISGPRYQPSSFASPAYRTAPVVRETMIIVELQLIGGSFGNSR